MIRNKPTLKAEANKAIHSLIITLFLMIITMTIGYLAIANSGAQRNYALEQEKLKNEKLRSRQMDLTSKITQKTTLDEIEKSDKLQTMEEIEEKDYLREEDNDIQ